jgi:hypothetical protein
MFCQGPRAKSGLRLYKLAAGPGAGLLINIQQSNPRRLSSINHMEGTPLFRPSKRSKFVRRHSSSEEEIAKPDLQAASEDGDFAQLAEKQSLSMNEILKLRQQTRSRGTGVSFSNTKTIAVEDMPEARALALVDPASDRLKAMSDRFIGHSDQVVDVDKHMCVPPCSKDFFKHL